MLKIPQLVTLPNSKHYRIIPSVYPTINFFEDLVNADEMEMLWEIESLTNDRLRQEVGDIFLVPGDERVVGPGSSVVMAAFTHIGKPSRFTDGSFGIYYASFSQKTAVNETIYHREKFLAATAEDPCEIDMRMYEAKLIRNMQLVIIRKTITIPNIWDECCERKNPGELCITVCVINTGSVLRHFGQKQLLCQSHWRI